MPRNIFAAEHLLRLFPTAHYINLIRDGRDVVVSHLDVNRRRDEKERLKFKQFSFGRTCKLWNACVETYLRISRDPVIQNRITNIFYEDLVKNPYKVISSLMDELGLPMDDQLLLRAK